MSDHAAAQRFAPPQADVADVAEPGLGLVEAGRGARLGAAVIDSFLMGAIVWCVILFGLGYGFAEVAGKPGIKIILGGVGLLTYVALNGWLLHTAGQTLGKRLVGLRIIGTDDGPVSLLRLVGLRYAVIAFFAQIPVVGIPIGLADSLFIFGRQRRCLHDLLAGTRVVTAGSSTGVYAAAA